LSTENQIQAQIQSEVASIQPYIDQLSVIASNASSLPASFSQCVGTGILAAVRAVTCAATSATNVINLGTQLTSAIQTAQQAATSSIDGTQITAPLQAATAEYETADEEATQCIEAALNSSSTAGTD
jgi:hypothetical protein